MIIMRKTLVLFTAILVIVSSVQLYAQQYGVCDYNTPISFPNGLTVECPDTDYELVLAMNSKV